MQKILITAAAIFLCSPLEAQMSLVAHSSGTATVTLGDTTGASMLVVTLSLGGGHNACSATMSDTVGGVATNNVWAHGTERHNPGANASECLFWSFSKAAGAALGTGATHVFTPSDNAFSTIDAAAFGGSLTGASNPFDAENGAVSDSAASLATGSITPAQNCSIIISAGAFRASTTYTSSPLTALDVRDWIAGTIIGSGLAYQFQLVAAPVSNTWTMAGAGQMAVEIASFKAASTSCGASTTAKRKVIQ